MLDKGNKYNITEVIKNLPFITIFGFSFSILVKIKSFFIDNIYTNL